MTTTSPSFTKEIRRNRKTRDFDMYLDDQYIGSRATYHQAEIDLDAHVLDLLSSDIVIPATTLDGQCGDCGAALDSMGLCGCQAEGPAPDPCKMNVLGTRWTVCGAPAEGPCYCDVTVYATDHTRPAPLSCVVCGNPAPILEPYGAFCGACFEGQRLWTLWHNDACGLVAYLRLAAGHLDDLARCLALYLSRKTGTALSMDSILAMWRNLLADDEPEPPALAMRAAA